MPTATADRTDVLSTLVAQRDEAYERLERLYEDAAEREAMSEEEHSDDSEKSEMTDEEKQAQAEKEESDEKEMEAEEKKIQASITRLDSKIKRYQAHASAREKHAQTMAEIAASNPAATPEQRQAARRPNVKVRESEMYHEGGRNSVFADLALSTWGDVAAGDRVRKFRAANQARARRDGTQELQPDGSWAANTTETGGGATAAIPGADPGMAAFIPPAWLYERWADRLVPGAPTLNNLDELGLPPDGMSIVIPAVSTPVRTTGGDSSTDPTARQHGEATAVRSVKVGGRLITANVETIAGEVRITRQMIDRGWMSDEVTYKTLRDDYRTKQNQLLLDGRGATENEPLGLVRQSETVPSATEAPLISQTKDSSSPTFEMFWGEYTSVEAKMHDRRFVAPNRIVCDPIRWGLTKGYVDGDKRPMLGQSQMISTAVNVPGVDNTNIRGMGLKGEVGGLPVIVDPSLPLQGNAGDQRGWLLVNTDDILVFTSGVQSLAVDEAHSSTLEVSVILYGYMAVIGNYRPGCLGLLKGTSYKV